VHITSVPSTKNIRILLSLQNLRTESNGMSLEIRHGFENTKLTVVAPDGTHATKLCMLPQ
jgi:hypothetical protein